MSGHNQRRQLGGAFQRVQKGIACPCVQTVGHFIQQQHFRLADKGTRHQHQPELPLGHGGYGLLQKMHAAKETYELIRRLAHFGRGLLRDVDRVGKAAEDQTLAVHPPLLMDNPLLLHGRYQRSHLTPRERRRIRPFRPMPEHPPRAPVINLIRPLLAAQQPQQRGLARAVAAADDGMFPLVECEVKIIQNMPFRTRIGHKHMLNFNERATRRFHNTLQRSAKKKENPAIPFHDNGTRKNNGLPAAFLPFQRGKAIVLLREYDGYPASFSPFRQTGPPPRGLPTSRKSLKRRG